jgi:hypothetical protein
MTFLKGLYHEIFGTGFFMNQHLIGPWEIPDNISNIALIWLE